MRAESGPMQFGEDWAGVFIRGDNAAYYRMSLETLLEKIALETFDRIAIESLIDLLKSSYQHTIDKNILQEMKDFKSCKK